MGRATVATPCTSRGCPDAVCCEDAYHPQLPVACRRLLPPPEREQLGAVIMLGHRGYTQRKLHPWQGRPSDECRVEPVGLNHWV